MFDPTACKWKGWDLKPGLLTTKPWLPTTTWLLRSHRILCRSSSSKKSSLISPPFHLPPSAPEPELSHGATCEHSEAQLDENLWAGVQTPVTSQAPYVCGQG